MKSRGFTLIELVIVMVIIGILFAVGITQMSHTSSGARAAAVQSLAANMKATIGTLIASGSPIGSPTANISYTDAVSGKLTSGTLASGAPIFADLLNATIGNELPTNWASTASSGAIYRVDATLASGCTVLYSSNVVTMNTTGC